MPFIQSIFSSSKKALFAIAALSFAFTVFVLQKWFLNTDFQLNDVSNFMFSEATANGVEVSARVGFFYRVTFMGIALYLLFFLLFHFLQQKWKLALEIHSDLVFISFVFVAFSWLQVMEIQTRFVLDTLFIFLCFKLVLILVFNRFNDSLLPLLHPFLVLKAALIAFLILFTTFFLFGESNFVIKQTPLIFSLFTFFVLFFPALVGRVFVGFQGSAIHLFFPFTFSPWLAFFVLEFNFLMHQNSGNFISYKWVFGVLFLILSGIYLLFIQSKKQWNWTRIVQFWFAPSILFAFVLLGYYAPVIPHESELFELANPANAVMNIYQFGKIPMLDFMTSHMFSEQWYGLIYTSIFGLNFQLDFLVYEFLNTAIFLFIVFVFLRKLSQNTWFSLLFVILFPFTHFVFFPAVFIGILPFLFLLKGTKLTDWKTYYFLMLICFGLLLWRIDTGVVSIYATVFFVPILWFVSKTKVPFKAIFISLCTMLLTIFILGGIALFFRSFDALLLNFKTALHYVAASQAHGFSQITSFFSQQFFIIHILIPIGAVFMLFSSVFYLRKSKFDLFDFDHKLALSIVFLILLFFANAQRGLVRHGFAEQHEFYFISTFVLALSLFSVLRYRKRRKQNQVFLFFFSCFFLFFAVKFFPYKPEKTELEKAIRHIEKSSISNPFQVSTYSGRMERNTEFEKNTYLDLKQFLDQNIAKNQTFLDFSNTPMLYYYCRREVPGYFNQNLQNSVDDFLFDALLSSISEDKIPVVVFHSVPKTWFDATDQIPNEVRYYKIAEFIHANYEPFSVINGKAIWVAKKAQFSWKNKLEIPQEQHELYDLKQIPGRYAAFLNSKKTNEKATSVCWEQSFKGIESDSIISTDCNVNQLNDVVYLSIEVDLKFQPKEINQWIRIVNSSDSSSLQLSFSRIDSVSSRYLFRLNNLAFWHRSGSKKLEFPANFGFKRIIIIKA
jgi:hypothetical protein